MRLRKGVGFFAYAIVAASPIERLPSQRKAGHPDVRRKDLHVLHPHVADRETEVRYVFCLRNAAVVIGLFFLQMSLADLRTTLDACWRASSRLRVVVSSSGMESTRKEVARSRARS